MKLLLSLITLMLFVGCTPIKDPRLSFGKKCKLTDDQVIWSHVWIYSKQEGVTASKEDCKFIPEK